jgi:hypothetical protein
MLLEYLGIYIDIPFPDKGLHKITILAKLATLATSKHPWDMV